jgi:hypothetical protein
MCNFLVPDERQSRNTSLLEVDAAGHIFTAFKVLSYFNRSKRHTGVKPVSSFPYPFVFSPLFFKPQKAAHL